MSGNRSKLVAGVCSVALATIAAFVAPWEGRKNEPYTDIGGVTTVCIGHTGSDVQARHYSDDECDALLLKDVAAANAVVRQCVGREMPVAVETALTDFAFNVGPGRRGVKDGFCVLKNGRPSTIRLRAQAGDWPGVCAQFQYWTTAAGRELPGLVKRRAAERALCEGGS